MTEDEASRIARYLRRIFGNPAIEVDAPATARDPAEMRIGDVLIGAVSKHEDEGETLYSLVIDIAPDDFGNGS